MFRRSVLSVGAVLGAMSLAACSGASTASSDDASPSSAPNVVGAKAPLLRLGMVDAPGEGGFVAAEMPFATRSAYGQAVFDTLVRADARNNLLPSLARDWVYSKDSLELTMILRDDVTFTDGTPFTADVAAQNLLRFRDGSAENASWLANVVDVVAEDDRTLVLTLARPDTALVANLSKAAGYMESPASFDDPAPVGTGPYILDGAQTVEDESYVFTANPAYWEPEYQHYDQIEMTVYEDPADMQSALLGRQLDAVLYAGYTGFDEIEAAGYVPHEFTLDWTGLFLFDHQGTLNEALGDVRVRQAINYAIDRQGLLDALLGGRGEITAQVFGPTTPGYDPALDSAYAFDPEKARALLAEAGYADGVTVEIPTVSFVPAATFDALKEQLAAVGITAELTEVSQQDYFGALLGGQFAVASMQIEQPITALETYQLSIATDAPWNTFHHPDEWVDVLGGKIEEGDPFAAPELNEYVVEQAWFAPWYRSLQVFYTAPGTDVVLQSGNSYPYLWNITPAES